MKRRLLLQAACAPVLAPAAAATPPLRVVASFSILADLVCQVGGDAVTVQALVGPDTDAHVYEPTPRDVRATAEAELVVVNGLGFEGWLERLLPASGFRGPVRTASAGIRPRLSGLSTDPHAWHDARLAEHYVATLTEAVVQLRPGLREPIEARSRAYRAELLAQDEAVRRRLAQVPRARRRVLTSHDAFGYFGDAYGVDFLAPQGLGTDKEASAATVARLVTQIRRQDVRAVFVENISSPRLVERIAREGGVRVGGALYSDALSGPAGPAPTYLKLFMHNANAICTALGA